MRSSTGLYPTSRRNEQDALSSPENWRQLPPRPQPEVFRFRGGSSSSIVHHRPRRRINNGSYGEPTTAPADISQEGGNSNSKKACWDGYQLQSSCHRLSKDEEKRQANVKKESISYLRAMALRRKKLQAMQMQLEEEVEKEDENEVVVNVKPKHKPVAERVALAPRNSRRVHSASVQSAQMLGRNKRKNNATPSARPPTKELSPPVEQISTPTCTRQSTRSHDIPYLDFITKKIATGSTTAEQTPTKAPPNEDDGADMPPAEDHVPIEIRVHTPSRWKDEMYVPTVRVGCESSTKRLEQIEQNQDEEEQQEEGTIDGIDNDLADEVRKLEERLQRLPSLRGEDNEVASHISCDNDNGSVEEEEVAESASRDASDHGGLLDDLSSDDTSMSAASSKNPRPPVLLGVPTGLPLHPYQPVASLDQNKSKGSSDRTVESRDKPVVFEDIIVGSLVDSLKYRDNND